MHSLSLVTRLLDDFLVLMMQASPTLLFRVKIYEIGQMIKVLCITETIELLVVKVNVADLDVCLVSMVTRFIVDLWG